MMRSTSGPALGVDEAVGVAERAGDEPDNASVTEVTAIAVRTPVAARISRPWPRPAARTRDQALRTGMRAKSSPGRDHTSRRVGSRTKPRYPIAAQGQTHGANSCPEG